MNNKIKINIITLICVFISHFLNAQNSVDSTAIYFELKKYDKAIEFAKNNYNLLIEYGLKLFTNKDLDNALPFLLKGYEIGENLLSNEDKIYIKSYIGVAYLKKSDYKNAIMNLEYGIKLQESLYGIKGQNYLEFQNWLAYTYKSNGEYIKAKNLYLKNIELVKKGSLIKDENFIKSLNGLADIYSDKGEFEKSETFYFQTLDAVKEIFSEKNEYYILTLKKIANLYKKQGQFTKSEEFYFKTKAIVKEINGENNLEYASLLIDLGDLYKSQYKYYLAEPLLLEALAIRKEILGERNDFYILNLQSLAQLYKFQGKNEKSEMIYLKSLSLSKEMFGEKKPKYADALLDLASFYERIGYYSKAERLYKEVTEIKKDLFGNNHPEYIESLNELARFYSNGGKFSEAENIFPKVLEFQKEIYGEESSDYAASTMFFGSLHLSQDKFSKAEELFLRSLGIYKKIYGENHRLYVANLSILANLYKRSNLNSKAANFYERYLISFRAKINDLYSSSENELINYFDIFLKKEIRVFSSPLTFISNFPDLYPKINIIAYNNEILIKNISIRNKELIKKSIKKNSNESIKIKYDKYLNNKIEINKNKELSLVNRPENFESLIIETDLLEKELIKESVSFTDFKKIVSISWEDIKSKLKENDISINIFQYISLENKIKYSVFLVKSHSKYPKIISLFEENQLELHLSSNDGTMKSDKINIQYSNKSITDLFLKPLEKELEGFSNIYLSLSGLSHKINFAALPLDKNQTFGEKYQLHILNSPAELIDYSSAKFDKKNNQQFILYGGIDYDKKDIPTSLTTEETLPDPEIQTLQNRSGIVNFGYLSGSKKEVTSIQSLANTNNFQSKILDDSEATEESVKQLDGRTSPFVLHLATHGFFFPDQERELPKPNELFEGKAKFLKSSDDPMLRSGLLFSGANKSWGKKNDNPNGDDGILTASEISNLDLSACQLVVLSACETGLGEVKGSEGVFGLQRAFKMAGVKNIIMSLWKVPDAQTAELFELFYSDCFGGKTIHEAFQSAQAKMKAKYSPYYWAGFVLLE